MRGLAAIALLLIATAARGELPSAPDAAIRAALTSGRPVLIDLGARSCKSCKEMAPVLEALATEYSGRAYVLFIDVREDQAAASKFGIRMIPTQIFFDARGMEVNRHVGVLDRAGLVQGLKTAGLK